MLIVERVFEASRDMFKVLNRLLEIIKKSNVVRVHNMSVGEVDWKQKMVVITEVFKNAHFWLETMGQDELNFRIKKLTNFTPKYVTLDNTEIFSNKISAYIFFQRKNLENHSHGY